MTEHEHLEHEHLAPLHVAHPEGAAVPASPAPEKRDVLTFKLSIDKNKIMPWLLLIFLAVVVAQTVQLVDIKLKLKTALASPQSPQGGAQVISSGSSSDSASSLPKMVGGC